MTIDTSPSPIPETAVPEVSEASGSFFSSIPTEVYVALGLIVIAGLLYLLLRKRKGATGKQVFTTRMLANAAICIALSCVLSTIRIFRMPQGGSITPASMLPMLAFAYVYGFKPSLLASLAYGLLQLVLDGYILSPMQGLLDYIIAYLGIALCGLASRLPDKYGYIVGTLASGVWRFICSVLSGVIFFANYAPIGQNVWIYSMGYNSVLLIDSAICLVIFMIPGVRGALKRMARVS